MTVGQTSEQASPDAQFAALLSQFPPDTVALVEGCLSRLRRAVPSTHQIVYPYPDSLVVTFGMSERGYEGIVTISVRPDAVRLYFDKSLPDPEGLLGGSGSKVRSLPITAASDLDRPAIQALFTAAIKHAGVKFPAKAPPPQMIIKSSKKPGKASSRGAK